MLGIAGTLLRAERTRSRPCGAHHLGRQREVVARGRQRCWCRDGCEGGFTAAVDPQQPRASWGRTVSTSSRRSDAAEAAEWHGLQCPRHRLPETCTRVATFAAPGSEWPQQAALVPGRGLVCRCPKLTPSVLCA